MIIAQEHLFYAVAQDWEIFPYCPVSECLCSIDVRVTFTGTKATVDGCNWTNKSQNNSLHNQFRTGALREGPDRECREVSLLIQF